MKDPLPWDTVPSARFAKEDRVEPVLEALRANVSAASGNRKRLCVDS